MKFFTIVELDGESEAGGAWPWNHAYRTIEGAKAAIEVERVEIERLNSDLSEEDDDPKLEPLEWKPSEPLAQNQNQWEGTTRDGFEKYIITETEVAE